MNFTGERFIPGVTGDIEAEHFHRYLLALKVAHGRDILDIACGEGYGSNILADVARKVIGVDISEEATAHARVTYQKPNLSFQIGTCAQIPLDSSSVDLIVSFETIEHHDQHDAMMREFKRVLRPGGLVLISSPNRPEFDRLLSEPNHFHVKELDYNEFVNLLNMHFANTAYYSQRVLSGSLLVPYHHEESGFTYFTGMDARNTSLELDRPIFFLAFASDADLPMLSTSFYECQDSASIVNAVYLETRVYFSEYKNKTALMYSEARSISEIYRVDGTRKSVQLAFPFDLQPLAHLRLDIANAPSAIELHSISLSNVDGSYLWKWDGNYDIFINRNEVMFMQTDDGVNAICLNGDPQFELGILGEDLSLIRGGAFIQITFTPKPLLELLPEILEQFFKVNTPRKKIPGPIVSLGRLSLQLQEISLLIHTHFHNKNNKIAAQHAELETLLNAQGLIYDELRRAEAQLELLKDVLLDGLENDRL